MTRSTKKDLERQYLDRVRQLLLDFPDGPIEDREAPDFLLRAADRVIGIEVTELHQAPDGQAVPQQGREALREQIVERARELYDAAGHPPVDSKLHLKDLSYRRTDINPLAKAIAELTRRNIPPEGVLWQSERYDWENRLYFPEVVDYIRVARYGDMTRSFFSCDGSTWPAPMPVDEVRRMVDRKSDSIDAYLAHCDEAWLVIAADGHRMATWFQDDVEVRAAIFETRFARLFILRSFGQHLIELRTAKAAAARLNGRPAVV